MKKVYLLKDKHSAKFNMMFPKDTPLNYSENLGSVQHPNNENIWLKIEGKDFREYITHNECDVPCGGTYGVGSIETTYNELKKVFGKPHGSDGYKSDAEWEILFADGSVATIYNWKNGKNYLGRDGIAKTKITHWNVGGFNNSVIEKIKEILRKL